MNYQKILDNLIEKARSEQRVKDAEHYYETHHITPKSVGGSNDPDNLVNLTAREHFIAHWLLAKIYPDEPSIIFAFNSFSMRLNHNDNHIQYVSSLSKNYEYARKRVINMLTGKPINPELREWFIGTTYINNGFENKRIKANRLPNYLNNGWVKGRMKYKRVSPTEETRQKISESKTGKKLPPEAKQKWAKFNKEHPHCWVSKYNMSKQILLENIDSYLQDGWVRGRLVLSKIDYKNMKFIKKDNLYRYVKPNELEKWLKFGWLEINYEEYVKNYKNNKTGTLWINNGINCLRVTNTELEIYLANGYKRGRLQNKS